ncbi:DnaJ-class molecular chaperone [Geitlerinema sp. FC II]|nr:DnaJ domain-containing protein [Geitlerinema sp. CS-897]PPT11131.1 DnaJ-class molecular chaperone [Geitlerinema sp. FC II]
MSLSFEIERGLFHLDFTDHHAILGISLDAEPKAIRKRYLSIARRLHPDVCKADNRELAQALLSKLVNPAYAKLSNEREWNDYGVLLRMTAKRLLQEHQSIALQDERAQALMREEGFESKYRAAIEELAGSQYEDLDRVVDTIGQLSELNFAYLFRREQQNKGWPKSKEERPNRPVPPPPPPRSSTDALVDKYFQRAQSLLQSQRFAQARKELQDALKLDANSSRCHGLMALVYVEQQKQNPSSVNLRLANTHLTKALKLDAKDPTALEARKQITRMMARSGDGKAKPKTKPPKKSDRGGGGLFGIFGGKKK